MRDTLSPWPSLEIEGALETVTLRIRSSGRETSVQILAETALAAGMWLLDLSLGNIATELQLDGVNRAETIGLTPGADGSGDLTVWLSVGDEESIISLNRVQAMLAAEHLMAHGIGGGARPTPRAPAPMHA